METPLSFLLFVSVGDRYDMGYPRLENFGRFQCFMPGDNKHGKLLGDRELEARRKSIQIIEVTEVRTAHLILKVVLWVLERETLFILDYKVVLNQ